MQRGSMKKISAPIHEYDDESEEEIARPEFVCIACQHEHEKWTARCSQCNAWSSIKPASDVERSRDDDDDFDQEQVKEPRPVLGESGTLFTATPSRPFFPRGFYWWGFEDTTVTFPLY